MLASVRPAGAITIVGLPGFSAAIGPCSKSAEENASNCAREFADLQRDLERGPVVDAARDNASALHLAIAVQCADRSQRLLDLLADLLRHLE